MSGGGKRCKRRRTGLTEKRRQIWRNIMTDALRSFSESTVVFMRFFSTSSIAPASQGRHESTTWGAPRTGERGGAGVWGIGESGCTTAGGRGAGGGLQASPL